MNPHLIRSNFNATRSSEFEGRATGAGRLRSVDLQGPAGRLEAILNTGAPDARYAAVVCHPHPQRGGTMHNKVVYHAMKAMNDAAWGLSWPVLRFNFRGTGLSEGQHDGKAETGDVLAALDWLEREYRLPLIVAGFSFGAAMALWACCGPERGSQTQTMCAPRLRWGCPPRPTATRTTIVFCTMQTHPNYF